MSSIEDVFNEFDEDEKGKKSSEDVKKLSKKSETEAVSVPEGKDESKEEVVEKTSAPSEEEGVADWFESAEEEPAKDKPVDEQLVEEDSVDEKAEESPAAETPAGSIEDWFEPSEEKATAETPSEVSAGAGVPMSVETSPIVRQAVSAEVMKEQMRQFQNLKASLLDKSDVATIQNKPFIKRSGWRKLALAFNLSDEIIKEEKEIIGDEFEWRIWVKAWAPNGRFSTGIGGCCSDERDFAHLRHDVYATAHTRAKNRALSDLIGSGEVSWEELRGMA